MFGKRETDVLVAGAGPVGMFAALLLAEKGVRVQVIDEQYRTAARSYALALHPRTLELLDQLGLANELISQGRRLTAVGFYDKAGKQASVRFSELSGKFPFLLVLPQAALEMALEKRLSAKGVHVDWSHRLADLTIDGGVATAHIERLARESAGYSVATSTWVVDKEMETKAHFMIGADGHRSRVRKSLGIEFPSVGTSQVFAVFEFQAERPAGDEASVVLDGGEASVMWPVAQNQFRWSFELKNPEELDPVREKSRLVVMLGDDTYNYLDPALLKRLLAERAPWFEAQPGQIAWSLSVRFERRLAAQFGRANAWLAGDAAHLAPPIGMQSMNGGIAEAAELAQRILAIRGGGRTDLLEEYGHASHEHWRRLLVDRRLDAAGASPFVSSHVEAIYDAIPASGEQLTALLRQLGIGLPTAA